MLAQSFNEIVTIETTIVTLSTVHFQQFPTTNSHKSHTNYQHYCHIYNCLHGYHLKLINFENNMEIYEFLASDS